MSEEGIPPLKITGIFQIKRKENTRTCTHIRVYYIYGELRLSEKKKIEGEMYIFNE